MTGKMSRNKGQRGEREVINLCQPIVDEVCVEYGVESPQLSRNLVQSQNGGHDIVGLDWLALEVKFQETFHINQWWEQTTRQAGEDQEPVLVYRKSRAKWRVMMFGEIVSGAVRIRIPVDITFEAFLGYMKVRVGYELRKQKGVEKS